MEDDELIGILMGDLEAGGMEDLVGKIRCLRIAVARFRG